MCTRQELRTISHFVCAKVNTVLCPGPQLIATWHIVVKKKVTNLCENARTLFAFFAFFCAQRDTLFINIALDLNVSRQSKFNFFALS